MKSFAKSTTTFVLIILFLTALLLSSFLLFGAAWLHTYKVFTQKTPVAEMTVSAIQQDKLGPYVDVELTQFNNPSAFSSLFVNDPSAKTESQAGTTEKYKLYGDVIYVGGPIVKFKDGLILVNFKTMYKVAKLFARYDIDNNLETTRTADMQSTYDLNGGLGPWKSISDAVASNGIKGKVLNLFIDTTDISMRGIYATNKKLTYTLYVTNTGFIWDLKQ